MSVTYRISSTATTQDNSLEVEPILDRESPRASFCITGGDPEARHMSPVVELDLEEIRELREILAKVDQALEPLWNNPEE